MMEYFYFSLFALSCRILVNAHSHKLSTILKGDLAGPREIKYIVSIYFNDADVCGGGIIDKRFVLSAAHCFIDDDDDTFFVGRYYIKAGLIDLSDPQAIVVDVEKIYVHGKYHAMLSSDDEPHFDIAVLKLSQELDLDHDRRLQALMLPRMNDKFIGLNATIAGFGLNELDVFINNRNEDPEEYGESYSKLYTAQAKVLENQNCKWHHYRSIDKSHMCAKVIKNRKERYYGVCSGDSGSPLVYKSKVIIGLLSASGFGCDESTDPGLYTRVSYYLTFIKKARMDKDSKMRTLIPDNTENSFLED